MVEGLQNDPLKAAVTRELRRGERLLWSGAKIRRMNWIALIGSWLFAIPWTAFALFWTWMAWGGTAGESLADRDLFGWIFPLFGLPFILVGLGMLSAPIARMFLAGRTIFAITDQRIVRLVVGPTVKSTSVPARRIGMVERLERPSGTGTLSIEVLNGERDDSPEEEPFANGMEERHRRLRQRQLDQLRNNFRLGEVENIRMAEARLREVTERARRISS